MSDIGYQPDFIRTDANHYDQKLIDTGGSAVKNVYIRSAFAPFEQAGEEPAPSSTSTRSRSTCPTAKAKALLGLQAWSAWLLFATVGERVRQRPHPQVRLRQREEDHTTGPAAACTPPADPGAGKAPECFTVLKAADGRFKIVDDLKPNTACTAAARSTVYTYGRLRQGRHPRRRRKVDQRPEVARSGWTSVMAGTMSGSCRPRSAP